MSSESTTAVAHIVEHIETMTAAFKQKDIQGVMASYESGAGVMFEPGKQVSDPELIQEIFGQWFQLNPDFTYPKGHEVFVASDIALHIAAWEMTGTGPDGSAVKQEGLSVAVLRQQEDGRWLLVLDNPHGQALLMKESAS